MDINLYRAFNNIDPFEDFRFDAAIASLTRLTAMVHGDKRSRVDQWMIKWDNPPETKEEKREKQAKLMQKVWDFFGRFGKDEKEKTK